MEGHATLAAVLPPCSVGRDFGRPR
jgi:hypothetical protein